jgi:uncharacterized protein (TIGR03083 family)
MDDATQLQEYIDTWWTVVGENVALLRELSPDDWTKPTDLPGWNVRYVAAHLAHLESDLAGKPQAHVEVPPADHIKGPMNVFTESGPLARADWSTDEIIEDLESSAAIRRDALLAMMPIDPDAPGDGLAALAGWNFRTLLSNRALDQWMQQQDIRRAVDRPGGLAGPGGAHVLRSFSRGLPFVVGKRIRPPAGTTVVLDISGDHPVTLTAAMGDDGRATSPSSPPADPTARIAMDFETFIILSGGRRTADQVSTSVSGDTELGEAVLAHLAVTP